MSKDNSEKYDEEIEESVYFEISYFNSEKGFKVEEEEFFDIDWSIINNTAKRCECDTIEIVQINETRKIDRYSLTAKGIEERIEGIIKEDKQ